MKKYKNGKKRKNVQRIKVVPNYQYFSLLKKKAELQTFVIFLLKVGHHFKLT